MDYLGIYDTALRASDVAALTSPVPEPWRWALLLPGAALLPMLRRRLG